MTQVLKRNSSSLFFSTFFFLCDGRRVIVLMLNVMYEQVAVPYWDAQSANIPLDERPHTSLPFLTD
jgi:acyl carrier protein phosphodiesterase